MSLYVQRSAPRVGQTNCPLLLALSEAKVNLLQPRPPSTSKNSFSSLVYCPIDNPASVLGRKFSAKHYREERLSPSHSVLSLFAFIEAYETDDYQIRHHHCQDWQLRRRDTLMSPLCSLHCLCPEHLLFHHHLRCNELH